MKKNWLLLTVFLLLFGIFGTACSVKNEQVNEIMLDGKPIFFEVEPVRINEKTYVEYSSLLKALGYQPEYDYKTKTIKAISPNRTIEVPLEETTAYVDGYPVYTNEDVKIINDKIMISVEFVSANSGKQLNWDEKNKTVLMTGPTPEQEADVLQFLRNYHTIEAAQDTEAYRSLFTKDTELDVKELVQQIEKVETRTTILGTFIDWYSEQEVILLVRNHISKISGGFYAENESKIEYTLHQGNGEWKIYDIEMLEAQYVDPKNLFDQAVEVPHEVKTEIGEVLHAQIEALNTGDIIGYTDMNLYDNDTVRENYLSLIPVVFDGLTDTTIEKWAIVEYKEPDQATLLISKIQDIKTEGKVRKIYSIGLQKVDGKWKFLLNTAVYLSEQVN